jgi:hypothetical protein
MRRRASPLVRIVRGLIGLVTVWCLGCSAYEPLLGSLLGSKAVAMMACDSEPAFAAEGARASQESRITAPTSRDSNDYDCGCGGSCHAPSASVARPTELRSPVAVVIAFQPIEPASISRSPLIPPPELRFS